MTILEQLTETDTWVMFYEHCSRMDMMCAEDSRKLFQYIRQQRYIPVVEKILNGQGVSVPVKKRISKEGASKKRIVYTLPKDETLVMKLLTWLMIRKYDNYLSPNLYSFRPGVGVKSAVKRIISDCDVRRSYSYKLDIRNYFNSIDVTILLSSLKVLFKEDPQLYYFFETMLYDPRAYDGGEIIYEKKGVMAGLPTAVFFANVYLTALDRVFEKMSDIIYCRYSDDIIIFASDPQRLNRAKSVLHEFLREYNLEVNTDKERETVPGEKWIFLGFSYLNGEIDVSEMSVRKLKAKMRRKARALVRWKRAKGKDDWMAARAFIKHFNRKLYASDDAHEINWSRWYFPLLTTDRSLKEIDAYMQDCIRYIVTEARTKSRFNFRYDQMKEMGYINMVNRYYRYKTIKKQ